ncbi:mannose-binding protein [Streptomyces sp. NPDC006296]|uniref:mannose-binding protein n=1 Tax=Streptomyces sp. NPDC006296 TaxID=3156746 RepID=UPI0033A3D47B
MSPRHPDSGTQAAAAAPDAQAPEAPQPPSGQTGAERGPEAAPEARQAPETTPAPEPESAPRPEPDADTVAAAKSGAGAASADERSTAATVTNGAATAVATAAVAAPDAKTRTGVDGGRPSAPMLAGAAFLGAALIAIPVLLVGSADDDRGDDTPRKTVAGSADTVLNPNSGPAAVGDYVAGTPSPSPSKEVKKVEAPRTTAPQPVAPAPRPEPSSSPSKKPKPKAAPKPDWTTVAVSAPSVLEVNQAWTTNRIRMIMQADGNLVVLNEEGKPIWAAMTFGPNHRAIFQPDGNLVIHNGDDRPIWASKTHDHPGAQLVLRADAKVVVVDGGNVVWST